MLVNRYLPRLLMENVSLLVAQNVHPTHIVFVGFMDTKRKYS